MRNALGMALAMCLAAAPLGAQWSGDDEDSVFSETVTGAAAVTPQVAMHRCLTLGGHRGKTAGPFRLYPRCTVRSWTERKPVGGERFFVAVYERLDTGSVGEGSEMREKETVLFSRASGASRLTPTWHAVYVQEFIGSVDLDVASVTGGGGGVLMAASACANGTAGCFQKFLLRRGGRWIPVTESWFSSLPRAFRSRLQDAFVDPVTLRATAGLASPRDPHCCPSQELRAQLALQGTRLVLRSYRVGPPRN